MNRTIPPSSASICRFLRAKNAYGILEGGENPWYLVDELNTYFHCLCTGRSTGPDNQPAAANLCREGRKCFVPQAVSPPQTPE